MNSKLCKKLRKITKQKLPNAQEVQYTIKNKCLKMIPPNPPMHNGFGPDFFQSNGGTIALHHECQRGLYQSTKRFIKNM